MEDSGKHPFHGLEHDSNEDAALQNPLPHLYPPRLRSFRKKTTPKKYHKTNLWSQDGLQPLWTLSYFACNKHHLNSPAQLVRCSTPPAIFWAQAVVTGVFPPPPPGYCSSFLSSIVLSIPTFHLLCSSICIEFRQLTLSRFRPVDL